MASVEAFGRENVLGIFGLLILSGVAKMQIQKRGEK